jgi:peptide/nickel transport system permease protein
MAGWTPGFITNRKKLLKGSLDMNTNAGTSVPGKRVELKHHGFWFDLFRRLIREKPLGTFGLVIVIILFIVGIFAPLLAPYGMNEQHLIDRLKPPSSAYLLGTDQLGRDILSRLIFGARVSMIIGLCATAVSEGLATIIGVISGYFGGKLDLIVQRFVDAWMSLPGFIVVMTVMSIVGSGMFQLIMIIGIQSAIGHSRVIRSAVIGIKANMYVSAANAIGCSPIRTMLRHIVPNVTAVIIIGFTIGMGSAIMYEASLSFLGFGVPLGVPSWGSMLSMEGRIYMETVPTLALWPGAALTLVVYSINMFGDSLRDLLDPRLRGGIGHYSLKKNTIRNRIYNKTE